MRVKTIQLNKKHSPGQEESERGKRFCFVVGFFGRGAAGRGELLLHILNSQVLQNVVTLYNCNFFFLSILRKTVKHPTPVSFCSPGRKGTALTRGPAVAQETGVPSGTCQVTTDLKTGQRAKPEVPGDRNYYGLHCATLAPRAPHPTVQHSPPAKP